MSCLITTTTPIHLMLDDKYYPNNVMPDDHNTNTSYARRGFLRQPKAMPWELTSVRALAEDLDVTPSFVQSTRSNRARYSDLGSPSEHSVARKLPNGAAFRLGVTVKTLNCAQIANDAAFSPGVTVKTLNCAQIAEWCARHPDVGSP